jgi:hypothetical protein
VDPTANAGLPNIITGVGFGDLFCRINVGGEWRAPQNLTNTPDTDERFFSLATRNPNGAAHLLFQASATNQAGIAEAQDRGTTPTLYVRRIAWLERHMDASVVAVDPPALPATAPRALVVQPNPGRGAVQLAAAAGQAAGAALVFTVDGRRVRRLALDQGRATWDGRDESGRPVPAGVYLARLEGERSAAARFMWLN